MTLGELLSDRDAGAASRENADIRFGWRKEPSHGTFSKDLRAPKRGSR